MALAREKRALMRRGGGPIRMGALRLLVAAVVTAVTGAAQSDTPYSPYAGRDYPTNVYWGDTHLHTTNSPDAWSFGNRILTPDEAFRFARGAEVTTQSGPRLRLRKPLDFLDGGLDFVEENLHKFLF